MVGDHDDPEIVERSRMMSREIPGAKEVVVKGAGHMVNLEGSQPQNHQIVAPFLDHRVAGGPGLGSTTQACPGSRPDN